MNLNRVQFAGRLTRDPQLKYLPSQTACCEFTVASNRRKHVRDGAQQPTGEKSVETCFLDVVAFGKQAEQINQHFQKGKTIYVEGRLKYDVWEDRAGGQKRSKISLILSDYEFVTPPPTGDEAIRAPSSGGGPPAKDPKENFTDADIPF